MRLLFENLKKISRLFFYLLEILTKLKKIKTNFYDFLKITKRVNSRIENNVLVVRLRPDTTIHTSDPIYQGSIIHA